MPATLFGVPSSHPVLAAELMLQRKGVEYRRVDLPAGLHRVGVRLLGFEGVTVPALWIGPARVQGTRRIALALDALVRRPALVPAKRRLRAAVLAAESWGDEVLQPVPRRVVPATLLREPSALGGYLAGARLGIPVGMAVRVAPAVLRLSTGLNRATDENVRRDLAALPAMLDHVDGLLADGVIGGAKPNVADYQIASSVSLLLTMADLRPHIEGRPAGRHARAIVPHQDGSLGPVLPTAWLAPLRAGA